VSYVIAAALAAILGVFELHSRLEVPPTARFGALRWWITLAVVEATSGIAGAGIFDVAYQSHWATGWAAGLAAGVGGPAAARLRVVATGKGDEEMPYGVATVYKPARDICERRIDSCGAARFSHWLNEEVFPAIDRAGITPEEICHRLSDAVSATMTRQVQKAEEIKFLKETSNDTRSEWSDAQKIRAMIQRACELQLFETVKDIAEVARVRSGTLA
jgi:hypothetical protein